MTKIHFILILISIINSHATNLPATCLNSFKRAALEAHNAYRTLHRVPLLVLDDMDNEAQNYAQKLANNNQGLKHSSNRIDKGENLFAKFTSQRLFNHDFCFEMGKECVKKWYNEVKSYSFNKPGFNSNTGHFTQLVWKDSRKLSLGLGHGKLNTIMNSFYCVAQYKPAGNVMGHFKGNVLEPRY